MKKDIQEKTCRITQSCKLFVNKISWDDDVKFALGKDHVIAAAASDLLFIYYNRNKLAYLTNSLMSSFHCFPVCSSIKGSLLLLSNCLNCCASFMHKS